MIGDLGKYNVNSVCAMGSYSCIFNLYYLILIIWCKYVYTLIKDWNTAKILNCIYYFKSILFLRIVLL